MVISPFFCIIVLQELGVPGLPNEIVLFYFGFLGHQYHLVYPLVTRLVVLADTLGSFLLYLVFYYGRSWLHYIKPARILQVSQVLYGRVILFTALLWSGGWIRAGWLVFGYLRR